MLPVILFLFSAVTAVIWMARRAPNERAERTERLTLFLRALLFWNVGVLGILAAYAHTFLANETAHEIGWRAGSPFQFEIAMANLALGVAGITAAFVRNLSFARAVILVDVIFLLGAFVGHMFQWYRGDVDPYNIGAFVWTGDLFIPVVLLVLLAAIRRHDRRTIK